MLPLKLFFRFLIVGRIENITLSIQSAASSENEDTIYNKTIFQIATDYYGINRVQIKTAYLISDNLEHRLDNYTLSDIYSCYFFFFKSPLASTLDDVISIIKKGEIHPLSIIPWELIGIRLRNSSFVNQYFPKNYNESVTSFCRLYLNFMDTYYEYFVLEPIIKDTLKTNKTVFTHLLSHFHLNTVFHQYSKGISLGNNYISTSARMSIKMKMDGYTDNITLLQDHDNMSVFSLLEMKSNVSGDLLKCLYQYTQIRPGFYTESKLYKYLTIGQLKMDLNINDSNSLSELFVMTHKKWKMLDAINDNYIIILASKIGLYGIDKAAQSTVMNILEKSTNLSAKFIITLTDLSENQKLHVSNYSIENLFTRYFSNYSLPRIMHFKMKYLLLGHHFQSLTRGSRQSQAKKRNLATAEGVKYVVRQIKLNLVKQIYDLHNDSLSKHSVTEMLARNLGMYENEIPIYVRSFPSFNPMKFKSLQEMMKGFKVNYDMTLVEAANVYLRIIKNVSLSTSFVCIALNNSSTSFFKKEHQVQIYKHLKVERKLFST